MSETAVNIERVVREVLAELGLSKAESSGKAPEPAPLAPRPSSLAPVSDDLAVSSRVVTMREVAGQLDSARRLVVSREAIVTPAVRDELLRRGVALVHADSSDGRPATSARLVMITMGSDFDPAALVAGLTREGFQVEQTLSDCLISATDQLAAEAARPDTLGMLLTRHTAAGLCLANRLRGVRAVTGSDAPAVATAAAAVGANVLVADPQAGTFFQLKQIATEFCRSGVRSCPEVFRGKLA